MSAAGRGGPRIEADNYPTPAWCTRRILDALFGVGGLVPDHTGDLPRVWEPCAGEGAIVSVLSAYDAKALITATDVREVPGLSGTFDATGKRSTGTPRYDLLITNPPFGVAHEIIQAQRDTARLCVYLLRSSFIAGERAEAYRNDMPDEYRLPERPEFVASGRCKGGGWYQDGSPRFDVGCGWSEKIHIHAPRFDTCPTCMGRVAYSTTDATPYSWFVWGPQRRSVGRSIILPATPREERKAA